jgi:hypothetical protein
MGEPFEVDSFADAQLLWVHCQVAPTTLVGTGRLILVASFLVRSSVPRKADVIIVPPRAELELKPNVAAYFVNVVESPQLSPEPLFVFHLRSLDVPADPPLSKFSRFDETLPVGGAAGGGSRTATFCSRDGSSGVGFGSGGAGP